MLYFYHFFFLNNPATTEIYTLPLHDALPIWAPASALIASPASRRVAVSARGPASASSSPSAPNAPATDPMDKARSEEHTSELQSRQYLVCRLLLEKKKNVDSNTQSADTTDEC